MGSLRMSDPLTQPWRIFPQDSDPWGESVYNSLKKEIVTHELLKEVELEFFNVLLIGQVSSGKSSFYNTLESVFGDYVTNRADSGIVDSSLTTKFRVYKVKSTDTENKPLAFQFCDTMGLSATSGMEPADYGKIMDGLVQDGDDLRGELGTDFEILKEDKMHCVVFVVDASKISFMDEEITKKMAKIREEATDRILNPIVILSRIDECCSELHKDTGDITQVFQSQTVRDLVVQVSKIFGVSENMVFPVQNYSSQNEKVMGIDILLLRALRQILRCSKTFVDDMIERDIRKQKKIKRRDEEKQKQRERARQEELMHARANVETLERLEISPNKASAEKKRAPSRPKPVYRAIESRKGEDHDELNMVKGEKFEVLNQDDGNGWALVKNNSGISGLVPVEWIAIVDTGTLYI